MAHRLANGKYRHHGVLISVEKIPTSTGWGFEWKVRGHKCETLKAAVAYIEAEEAKQ